MKWKITIYTPSKNLPQRMICPGRVLNSFEDYTRLVADRQPGTLVDMLFNCWVLVRARSTLRSFTEPPTNRLTLQLSKKTSKKLWRPTSTMPSPRPTRHWSTNHRRPQWPLAPKWRDHSSARATKCCRTRPLSAPARARESPFPSAPSRNSALNIPNSPWETPEIA